MATVVQSHSEEFVSSNRHLSLTHLTAHTSPTFISFVLFSFNDRNVHIQGRPTVQLQENLNLTPGSCGLQLSVMNQGISRFPYQFQRMLNHL